MTRKTKRIIRVRVATVLRYVTCAIMVLAIAGLAYLVIDFMGLVAWVASGQVPEGGFDTGFYFGRINYIIISLIIK